MSKEKVRLYQLARELNVESKDLIDLLKAAGSDVRNHMTTIDADTRQLALDLISGKVKPETVRPQEPKPRPAVQPEQIPEPKGKRLVEIRSTKPALDETTEVAEPFPADSRAPEPVAAELEIEEEPAEADEVEEVPVAAAVVGEAPAASAKTLGPIPSPTRSRVTDLGGTPSTSPKPRIGDRRPTRPRPIVAPPLGIPKPLGPQPEKPKKPDVAAQKPVMKLSPEALRGGKAQTPAAPGVATPDEDVDEARLDEDADAKKKRRGGAMAGREERQKRRGQRAAARREVDLTGTEEPESDDAPRRSGLRQRARRSLVQAQGGGPIVLESPITIRSFSEAAGIRANQLQSRLMNMGIMASINQTLSEQQAEELALELSLEVQFKREKDSEQWLEEEFSREVEDGERQSRPPVVTFMGHVDHGKTSLMDRIRQTNVVATEAGGITQHIGAYQVPVKDGMITFLDTPGHEAFTAMRARGANVTDIVVLVVAADDGVMPQTVEAISHAKAANVPIVVAMNKADLPNTDFNRLKHELSQHNLIPEEWGGDTLMTPTSATTGAGLDELLVNITTVAELLELGATPERPASGTCIEASLSEDRGVQCTVLVQDGTLRRGDNIVCGTAFGRVRAMYDQNNQLTDEAGPSTPVVVTGMDEVPEAGERFFVLADVSKSREIAEERKQKARALQQGPARHVSLETLFDNLREAKLRELKLILKADVRGSLEAIRKEISELKHAEVRVQVIHEAVGGIAESDILLADASDAIVIGFRVVPDDRAQALANEKGVEIRRYEIIYQVIDEIKKALEGLLAPERREVQQGKVVVQQTFTISRVGTVAGCRVVQGIVERGSSIRIIRDGAVIGTYPIDTLRRVKDDVREVRDGMECGIKLAGFNDVKRDDVFEAFKIEEIKRTI